MQFMKYQDRKHWFDRLPMGMFFWVFCAIEFLPETPANCQEKENDNVLWNSPRVSAFLIRPGVGWSFDSTNSQLDGLTVNFSGAYTLRYLLAGLNAQAIFNDKGTLYSLGVDIIGRYGPLYGGGGFSGYWLPYRSNTPVPSLIAQAGVYVPLPLEGFFLDLSYRLSILLFETRQSMVHSVLLGLVVETGS